MKTMLAVLPEKANDLTAAMFAIVEMFQPHIWKPNITKYPQKLMKQANTTSTQLINNRTTCKLTKIMSFLAPKETAERITLCKNFLSLHFCNDFKLLFVLQEKPVKLKRVTTCIIIDVTGV